MMRNSKNLINMRFLRNPFSENGISTHDHLAELVHVNFDRVLCVYFIVNITS